MPAARTLPVSSRTLIVPCPHGIHLRVAARIVRLAKSFRATIRLRSGSGTADARSMLSILGLNASHGATVRVTAKGIDAGQAVEELAKLLQSEAVFCGVPA